MSQEIQSNDAAKSHDLASFYRNGFVLGMVIVLGASLIFERWRWAKIPEMYPRFADLRMITATADCVRRGGWTISSETCDVFGRPYNYPTIWAKTFAFFGLGTKSTELIGFIFGILLIATFSALVYNLVRKNCSMSQLLIVFLSSVSPPVLLLLERGNSDIVVLFLIVIAALKFEKNPKLSAVISAFAIGLKLFPAMVGVMFFQRRKGVKALFLLVFPSLKILNEITQRTGQNKSFSFGATSTAAIFFPEALTTNGLIMLPVNAVLTVGASLLLFTWFSKSLKSTAEKIRMGTPETNLFYFSGWVFFGTYISGTRFDYSLSFLVPLVTAIALIRNKNKLLIGLQYLIVGSLWLAFTIRIDLALADILVTLITIMFLAIWIAKSHNSLKTNRNIA
jgi:hypothetical protein